jgi:hypothetical protein
VGYNVLVTFFDCLFATLGFGELGFEVFETGELTVYCDECCFSVLLGTVERIVRYCSFNLR